MKASGMVVRGVLGCSVFLLAGCGAQQIDFQGIIANAKQKVYPGLVFIKPIQETFQAGERRQMEVFGSGVIISADGYVVTNNHVAEKAIEVNCVLGDREQVPATVVGLDPETDLALLKLKLPEGHPPLTVAEFGDSDKVDAGQFVMALGSPFGFTRSISLGIISNTKRYIGFTTRYRYNLWLQTDAAINPGNSGGPLVDTNGKVIGINTLGLGWGAEGIGFAIPSKVVHDVVQRLKVVAAQTDPKKWPVKVERAYTGLQLQALNDFYSNTFTDARAGVLVQSVDQDSPAAQAGIGDGDILLSVNGAAIDGAYVEELPGIRGVLADLPVDKPAKLLVARERVEPAREAPAGAYTGKIGKRKIVAIDVTPVTRGKFEGEDFDCRRWNMTVKEITKFSNPRLCFLQPGGGVFVQGIRSSGNAADAGFTENDIILNVSNPEVGNWDIKTIADVKKAYEALVNDKKLVQKKAVITIKRGAFTEWKTLDWTQDYLKED
jgi:serine protease Do